MKLALAVFLTFAGPAVISFADQTRSLEKHYQVSPSQRIELHGLSGAEIEFKSWDRNEVSIKIDVRISSSDAEYEKEYLDALDIQETHNDKEFVITMKELNRGVSSGFWNIFSGRVFLKKDIRGEVYVPRANALTTDFSYGSIMLDNMKGEINIRGKSNKVSLKNCASVQRIENDYGTTEIEQSGGDLNLRGTSSTVSALSFTGAVSINADYSTITLRDVAQSASVESKSGKLTAENINGDLTVRADYSTIVASHVKGMLNVETKSGSLRAQDIKGLTVDAPYSTVEATGITGIPGKEVSVAGQSDPIALEAVSGNVVVNSPYSSISLRGIQGSVNVSTKSGRVTADDVSGDWSAKTEYTSLDLRRLRSRSVTITNKSANVDLDLAVVPNTLTVRNEYGSVSVSVPKGYSGDITLDAEYGSVETDFPIRVKNKGSSGYAIGKVGSGTGSISIETKSGNIELTQR